MELPMSDRSNGRGKMKCSPRSSRLSFGRWAKEPTPEIFTFTKTWKGVRTHTGFKVSKKEEEESTNLKTRIIVESKLRDREFSLLLWKKLRPTLPVVKQTLSKGSPWNSHYAIVEYGHNNLYILTGPFYNS
jgi:hypothetical protein